LRMNLSKAKLRDTGWKTAQLTGALAYMSYAEAQTFNDIYDKQSAYLARQEAVLEDIAQWIGLATRITHSNSSRLTPDQASALYDWLGTWEGHLALLHVAAKVAADRQHAYLEQRAPLENIHESIQTDSEAAEEPKK